MTGSEPSHVSRRTCVACAAAWLAPQCNAAPDAGRVSRVLTVGSGAAFADLASAIERSADGDRIELLPGVYRGQVAVAEGKRITIRGLGAGAVLEAAGRHAMGKGILVVRGEVTVENIEFRGARVPDGNGAGIRFDHGHLRVRRCRFIDNEMGLLTGNQPATQLEIEDSVFADAPRHAGQLHHLLYAGAIARLVLTGNRFENGWRGHLVKSRARENLITCNLLRDGPTGGASYELELAHGGHNRVSGNIIVQGPGTQNPTLVAVGYDADPALEHSLVFVHNTLVNAGPAGARFVHLAQARMPKLAPLLFANNLWVGSGALPLPQGADTGGNVRLALADLRDAAAGDYRPRAACRGTPGAGGSTDDWRPRRELTPPLGTRDLGSRRPGCAGALQPEA